MTLKQLLGFTFIGLALLLSISCGSISNPIASLTAVDRYPIYQSGKWGFIDRKGTVVVTPQFSLVLPYTEGLAAACIDQRCGYIDPDGKYVVNPQFEDAGRFSEGLAAVSLSGKIGYIDKSGKYVINPQFARLGGPGLESLSNNAFSQGLAVGKVGDKCGFVDKEGKLQINPQFDAAQPFFEGLAAVRIGDKWGYVDTQGKIIINPQFENAQPFVKGLAVVFMGKQAGYIDNTGKIIINPQFDAAYPFSSDGIARVWTGGKTGFIGKDGKYIVNPQFGSLGPEYQVGTIMIFTSDIGSISFSDGLTAVSIGDKAGFIDNTGKIVINPQFEFASPFFNGLALVINSRGPGGNDMGWIDKEGKFVWRSTSDSSTAAKPAVNNVPPTNSMAPASNSAASSKRTGRLTTDSNIRSESNKNASSLGIHFKGAKLQILEETSYTLDSGEVSTWFRVRITEYGCSVDTNLGCGKNNPNDADEGWVNAKNVLID